MIIEERLTQTQMGFVSCTEPCLGASKAVDYTRWCSHRQAKQRGRLPIPLPALCCPCVALLVPAPLPHHPPVTLFPAPKDSPYSRRGAAPQQPMASSPALCSSTIFTTPCVRSLQDSAQPVPCGTKGKNRC